jgi:hypothetical protein
MGTRPLALKFPTPDWVPDPSTHRDPHPILAIAIILALAGYPMAFGLGVWSGATREHGSQLGQALSLMVRAPTLDSALAESRITMRRLDTLAATATRPRNRPPAPRHAVSSLPAPTDTAKRP